MLKSVEETKARIEEVIEERQREIDQREKQLEESRSALITAEKGIESAIDTGDTKAYQKAKAEKAEAEDAIELREKRLDILKKAPLIDKIEYEKRAKSIIDELEAMTECQKDELYKIILDIKAVFDEADAEISEGNKTLARWQRDIYLNADRSTAPNGQIMKMNHEDKRFTNFAVTTFCHEILDGDFYKYLTERSNQEC